MSRFSGDGLSPGCCALHAWRPSGLPSVGLEPWKAVSRHALGASLSIPRTAARCQASHRACYECAACSLRVGEAAEFACRKCAPREWRETEGLATE